MEYVKKIQNMDYYKNMSFNDLKLELNSCKKLDNKNREMILRKLMKQKYLEHKSNITKNIDNILKNLEADKEEENANNTSNTSSTSSTSSSNQENTNTNPNPSSSSSINPSISFRPEMSNDIKLSSSNSTTNNYNLDRLKGDIYIRDFNSNNLDSSSRKKIQIMAPYEDSNNNNSNDKFADFK